MKCKNIPAEFHRERVGVASSADARFTHNKIEVELVCRRFNGTCYYTTQPRISPSISLDYFVWIGDLYTLTVLYCMEFEYS
ncbi:uncharacterized protein LOC111058640 [Nilaparvata lugens]|uniref:uncharacterized protein LOC111058640 n=1 Tax=Nilaparvata lugens TaxID=108931 RepID=UPI00193DF782|nr:uncharacterized protein LOC111058640 [Nilaparvata lugens]